jgi:hypothetical protein
MLLTLSRDVRPVAANIVNNDGWMRRFEGWSDLPAVSTTIHPIPLQMKTYRNADISGTGGYRILVKPCVDDVRSLRR